MSLRDLLEQATPGEWTMFDLGSQIKIAAPDFHVAEIDTSYDVPFDRAQCQADARLIALCPETTAWAIDVAAALETGGNFPALLARFRALEQKAAGGEA